jgi:GNAT superfamily N-acetyltransferase
MSVSLGILHRPHCVLIDAPDCHIVAVDPKHQGKGIGTLLTKWGVDVAEQLQVPMYLEASGDHSVHVYKKVGFRVLDKTIRLKAEMMGTEEDANAPLMARMPSSAGDLAFEEWVKQGRPNLGK